MVPMLDRKLVKVGFERTSSYRGRLPVWRAPSLPPIIGHVPNADDQTDGALVQPKATSRSLRWLWGSDIRSPNRRRSSAPIPPVGSGRSLRSSGLVSCPELPVK